MRRCCGRRTILGFPYRGGQQSTTAPGTHRDLNIGFSMKLGDFNGTNTDVMHALIVIQYFSPSACIFHAIEKLDNRLELENSTAHGNILVSC